MDICANECNLIFPGDTIAVSTGLFIELPIGYEAQIRPRSGLALNDGITIPNAPGTIDADYRGEIKVILHNGGTKTFSIKTGDRIAQMVIARYEKAELQEVSELGETERGEGGFGSTGKNVWVDTIRPGHYGKGTYEVINIINAWGLDFNTGNVLKYIARAGKKAGAAVKQDLEKALQYAKFHKEKQQYYSGSGIYEAISDEYNRKSVSAALFSENPHGANCIYYLCTNNVDSIIASLESWIKSI